MSMFSGGGTWWVYSEKSPRWNRQGHTNCIAMGFQPKEVKDAIDELKKLYGKIPSDLTVYYDKD